MRHVHRHMGCDHAGDRARPQPRGADAHPRSPRGDAHRDPRRQRRSRGHAAGPVIRAIVVSIRPAAMVARRCCVRGGRGPGVRARTSRFRRRVAGPATRHGHRPRRRPVRDQLAGTRRGGDAPRRGDRRGGLAAPARRAVPRGHRGHRGRGPRHRVRGRRRARTRHARRRPPRGGRGSPARRRRRDPRGGRGGVSHGGSPESICCRRRVPPAWNSSKRARLGISGPSGKPAQWAKNSCQPSSHRPESRRR